jgi:glycine/D-amino acid oxidase-like deaminating enzyme
MSAQTPGDKFPNQASHHSWLFNYDRGFDYLTQLPGGQMMLGGGFAQGEAGGLADLGISTDCDLSLYIDIHLSGALRAIFGGKDWGRVQGDAVQAMWTGNMAFSSDGFPWVGRLPGAATGRSGHGSEGAEWVCAAFGGEGMVQAWLSGKAMATMLLTQDAALSETVSGDISWLPEQLLVSEGRFSDAVLPKVVADDAHRSNL